MICLVKCGCSRWVKLPSGAHGANGDSFRCPSACPHKNGKCGNKTDFKVVQVREMNEADAERFSTEKYSTDETRDYFSLTTNEVVSEPEKKIEARKDYSGGDFKFTTAAAVEDTGEKSAVEAAVQKINDKIDATLQKISDKAATTEQRINDKYGIAGVSVSRRTAPNVSDYLTYTAEDSDKITVGGKTYNDCFELGGIVYTNDETLSGYGVQTKPLRYAFTDIFEYWDCGAVFEDRSAKKIRRQFGRLIDLCCENKIKTSEVEEILNKDCDANKKFFYLFYDLIFKRKPVGKFYYPSRNHRFGIEKVHSEFSDRSEFVYRYCKSGCEGEAFRTFYAENKNEILHYLNYESNEEKLFDDITLIQAKEFNNVVGFNGSEPVFFGTIKEFVEKMKTVGDVKEAGQMIKFLGRYKITSHYKVEKRTSYDQPLMQVSTGKKYEDRLFFALGIGKTMSAECATLYERYVCLLREYVTVFRPDEVSVGRLLFTKKNFSFEIRKVVVDLCKTVFGNSDAEEIDRVVGNAFLTKSLYEEDVFKVFPCENKGYIDEILQIIEKAVPSNRKTGQADKQEAMTTYFSKIANPVVRFGSEDVSVIEYIKRQVAFGDVLTVYNLFREDILIGTYLRVIKSGNANERLNAVYSKYQELYNKFVES